MKKFLIVLFAAVIGLSAGEHVAYASGISADADASKGATEKFKAEFSYEMAQITAKIVSAPRVNAESFKMELSYAMAKATAKVMPLIPDGQRSGFAYEMAQITTKLINAQHFDVEKTKAEFAYKMAQLTTKIITEAAAGAAVPQEADHAAADPAAPLLRNNADIEIKAADKPVSTAAAPQPSVPPAYITQDTYQGLVDDLLQVGDRSKHVDNKVHMDGEVRVHYAFNSSPEQWSRDTAGIRVRLGVDTRIDKNWSFNGMLEGEKSLLNYNNELHLPYRNVVGKIGAATVRAGAFGYFMAEGNIYDSAFKGVRTDWGGPVKYTLSYGESDYTKKTTIATARYNDFDYNLEAGVYHYQVDGGHDRNTIWTLAGNYNFSNFGIGAMLLNSNLKDSKGNSSGYVLSFNYGDLKTYRPGTYDAFIKYYNQPKGTYIMHGMNGLGGSGVLQGFKGYGWGTHYTFARDFVAGIEYYNLTDKISGEKGNTLWSDVTYYF